MEWTLERIEADLLANKCDELTIAREIVVAAVNRAEELLGPDWITRQTYGGKGLAVGMPIIQTGIELEFIEDVPRASDLLEEIRRDTQNARTELTAIYLLRSRRPSAELELYPEVGSRRADFLIREKGDPWTTVASLRLSANRPNIQVRSGSEWAAASSWPDYSRCVAGAFPNNAKDGADISRADFTWALMALRRGHSIEDTASRLAVLSSKEHENGDSYALRTAQNVAAAVERERRRSRSR